MLVVGLEVVGALVGDALAEEMDGEVVGKFVHL